MDAKVCDICGKTFVPDLGKGNHILGHVVRNEIMFKRRKSEGGCFSYDICDDCIDSLDTWARGRMMHTDLKENSDVH